MWVNFELLYDFFHFFLKVGAQLFKILLKLIRERNACYLYSAPPDRSHLGFQIR